MNKRTRIAALAAVLAVIAASAPLWAQSGEWPAWEGKNNADKTEWDEMGACWAGLMGAYRFLDNINVKAADDKRYAADVSGSAAAARSAANELRAYANKQKDDVKFWKKEKARFLDKLARLQQEVAVIQAEEQKAVFSYRLTDDSKGVVITGYKGRSGKVIIPAEIEGFPVVEIASRWQQGDAEKNITSLVIPDTVTRLPESTSESFYEWDCAFYGMSKLTEVTLPKGLKRIPNGMFGGCNALTSFTIPQGVTEIGNYAFQGSGLMSVTIPNTVTKIGKYAFNSCSKLTAITIPAGVTEIGSGAFSNSGLQSITIPDTVNKIGKGAFESCKSLTTVTVSPVKGRVWEQERDVRSGEWYWDTFSECTSLNLRSQAALTAAGYGGRDYERR